VYQKTKFVVNTRSNRQPMYSARMTWDCLRRIASRFRNACWWPLRCLFDGGQFTCFRGSAPLLSYYASFLSETCPDPCWPYRDGWTIVTFFDRQRTETYLHMILGLGLHSFAFNVLQHSFGHYFYVMQIVHSLFRAHFEKC